MAAVVAVPDGAPTINSGEPTTNTVNESVSYNKEPSYFGCITNYWDTVYNTTYYNSNGGFMWMNGNVSLGGISGIAGILLNEDKVILQDTIDTMNNYSNNPYLSDTDKQNIAQTYFDSGAGSVVFWQYQIVRGDGDWKKIK